MVTTALPETLSLYQERINCYLNAHLQQLPDAAETLKSAMLHGTLLGGKRVRPFLVYSIGEMLGAELDKLDACAAAVECIHAYSLIHDDLPAMDDDDLRRGQPTVHVAFDEATAILAGDALQAFAFDLLTDEQNPLSIAQQVKTVRTLAKASGYKGMCGGQAIDLASTDQAIDLERLTQLHSMKTGALILCAVEMALIVSNASAQEQAALIQYAKAIGLAFQVQDDILDITATTEELGKPQGSDTQANKSTYPQLLGLAGAQQKAEQLIDESLSALAKLPYNSELLADFARYIVTRRV